MQTKLGIRWWQWPNVLALDAALVGVGWLVLVGRNLFGPHEPSTAAIGVMGLSIWLVYTADHCLDARGLRLQNIKTARHRFAKRFQGLLGILWVLAMIIDLQLAFTGLSRYSILLGIGLTFLCLLHTKLAQHVGKLWPLKEAAVAAVFGMGILVFHLPTNLEMPHHSDWHIYLLPLSVSALAFGMLCYSNCAMIAEKERTIDTAMGRSSVATRFPAKRVLWSGLALVAVALGCFLLPADMNAVKLSLTISGICLAVLGVWMEMIPVEVFRVLADTAMLSPWVVLIL